MLVVYGYGVAVVVNAAIVVAVLVSARVAVPVAVAAAAGDGVAGAVQLVTVAVGRRGGRRWECGCEWDRLIIFLERTVNKKRYAFEGRPERYVRSTKGTCRYAGALAGGRH